MSLGGHTETQLFPKLLLHVSIQELHNIMVSPPGGGLKEARVGYNNIIVVDYMLQNILPHQLKNMYAKYKIICVCECFKYAKIMHS